MNKGNGHDEHWENLEADVRSFMSQYRQPGQSDPEPQIEDPREATEFGAVWDKLATHADTARIIEYINGTPCDPIPTLEEIVAAFYKAGKRKAIEPNQIYTTIMICGGQLSRYINLRNDINAVWAKLHSDQAFATEQKQEASNSAGIPFAQTVAAFIQTSVQPEYLIEPILQRGSVYTCTALTSHGKTAVLLYIALCVASGRQVAGKYTQHGRVVWLAGENPDDFAQKLVTACDHWGFDPAELNMVILPGAFDLAGKLEDAIKMAAADGEAALVVVDTSAAYRLDDGEDDNANSLAWGRVLRRLVSLPGRPAVVTAAHPTKHAEENNLLPRGGSAFLNEVDGNLTLWADEEQDTTTLHWQGKFRGMTFAPIVFELKPCQHPTWKLRNGEPVMIKLAIPTGDAPKPRPQRAANGGRPASDKADIARKILGDLLVTEGRFGIAPDGLPAALKERWRTEFYSRACIAEDKADTRLKSFTRAVDRLIAGNAVAANSQWVWLAHPEVV